MTSSLWSLVELAARPLDRDERDAVLGDSLEAGDSSWRALSGVLGFVLRRQFLLWKSWRPWLRIWFRRAVYLAPHDCIPLRDMHVGAASGT